MGYAYVNPGLLPFPNAVEGKNVSVANITRRQDSEGDPLVGQWCFHDLPFTVQGVIATGVGPGLNADVGNQEVDVMANFIGDLSFGCPPNTDALLGTRGAAGPANFSFHVWFAN